MSSDVVQSLWGFTRPPRKAALKHLVLFISLLCGCYQETERVVVVLYPRGLDETARWLLVSTTLGPQQTLLRNRFEPPLDEVSLQFDESASGDALFALEVRDTYGMVIASGQSAVTLAGIGRYQVEVPLTAAPRPEVLLRDSFDDGNFATNTGPLGVGSGFALHDLPSNQGSDKRAVEGLGEVTLDGGSLIKQLTSNDTFDPTGTTLTWVVRRRPSGVSTDAGVNAMAVGWVSGTTILCCGADLDLGLTDNDLVFDSSAHPAFRPDDRNLHIIAGTALENSVFDGTGVSDLILSLYVDLTSWRVDAIGPGMEVHQQGTYKAGSMLTDVLAAAGEPMRPACAIGREGASGVFESVLLTRP